MSRTRSVIPGLLGICLLAGVFARTGDARAADAIVTALHRAAGYLAAKQNPDGGYGPYGEEGRLEDTSDVGLTGLVLYALARHPRSYRPEDGPFISEAVGFLLSKQQKDGGFYDVRDPVLQNYRTSVVVMALARLDRQAHAEPIARAQKFIKRQQLDESRGYRPDAHLPYGAMSYGGSSLRGDLSNAALGADALFESGMSASDPVWKRLETFVSRCQNVPRVDPLLRRAAVGTSGDGGFRYAPNDTRGPVESIDGQRVFSSYGSMTYQGLKSLLYANVRRDDPRVVKAFEWISKNFTVKENPGMATPRDPRAGQQGLYYYYQAMAKALAAYGERVVVDRRGVKHDWARELSDHLLSHQHGEGYWVNRSDRWWEGIPELASAYAMVTLSICREELEKKPAK